MIRGWRNDPLWVAYYRQRRHERMLCEIARQQWEQAQIAQFEAACQAAETANAAGPPMMRPN